MRNEQDHTQQQSSQGEVQRRPGRMAAFFLHFILPLAAIVGGVAITVYLMKTSPEAKPGKRPRMATLVEVASVREGVQQTRIRVMGEVIPAHQIDIRPRVSGEVTDINQEFLPGGFFQTGETMLKIDPVDYGLVVQQLESEAEKAESDLLLEMGNQRIAEKELALLNEDVSEEEKALILRQPQLKKLQAEKKRAISRLEQARLDLQRTEIKAPFNGVILERNVNSGARVTESTVLAKLVGSDVFWLLLSIPVEQLQWINLPQNGKELGPRVNIKIPGRGGAAAIRTGHVLRLAASLEPQGRMAQVLVEVNDPLSQRVENQDKQRLLLGSYVEAEIEGVEIERGFLVARDNIHEGTKVWLMDEDGRLEIREVVISFRSKNKVIVTEGLKSGEMVITSSLASPIVGTLLRVSDSFVRNGKLSTVESTEGGGGHDQ